MGLPGSGKTTLAEKLHRRLAPCKWYNADDIRKSCNDWDFSAAGRIRQAERMRGLAQDSLAYGFTHIICDFVAPTKEIRNIFSADFTIWMDTIEHGRFEDTNKLFEPPTEYDIRITNYINQSLDEIVDLIRNSK